MTALVVARSAAGRELIAAARRLSGATGDAVLVGYVDAVIPELTDGMAGPGRGSDDFAAVVDLNAELAPHHPAEWRPADNELPMLRRILCDRWACGTVSELWVEDLDHAPATTIARIFDDVEIHVADPGLRAYGPAGTRRPQQLQQRIVTLWHRHLVPGLAPVEPVPTRAVATAAPAARAGLGPAMVIGADLTGDDLAGPAGEIDLHVELLRHAADAAAAVVFSPHPAMPPARRWLVLREAGRLGLPVRTACGRIDDLVADLDPALIVGCAPAALLRLQTAGHRVAALGTRQLLAASSPYHHRGRVPVTIVDALLGSDRQPAGPQELQALVEAVTFVMRPDGYPALREPAARLMADLPASLWGRYFRRHRAERLGLPIRG